MNHESFFGRGMAIRGLVLGAFIAGASPAQAQTDLILSGVIDGPLPGGLPKAVEFYVVNDIADLSIYGFGSANNGGGTDGEEFTFPSETAPAGSFLYVATEAVEFINWFGFAPDYTDGNAPSINGDDAIELFRNGTVVDIFGDIHIDGTGMPWEHLDGWAYRVDGTGPDGAIFQLASWTFSGPNALDGEVTNATAATPFPVGSFLPSGGDTAPVVTGTTPANGDVNVTVDANIVIDFSEPVTLTGSWFTIEGSSSGIHTATVSGSAQSFDLDPDIDFDSGETVTVTVVATQVTDLDSDDPPDNMTVDYAFSFASATGAGSGLVINEFLADPASGADGDANGDGIRDSSEDEFVEIVNITGGEVDLSGWTLSDAVGVRHTFPTGTVVCDDCAVVVFGGGAPTGTFGGAAVQIATSGLLGLNNSGDTVTLNNGVVDVASVVYGGEGGNNQSLTRDPDLTGTFVLHSTATGSGGTLFSPGTLIDGSPFPGAVVVISEFEIFEIQGSGPMSPLVGQTVFSRDNVVTAVDTNGFFMQTPEARADANPETSDGIFVFTGGAPSVAVGDGVDVTGTVAEFFDLTELSGNPTVTLQSAGNPLPAPVAFDDLTPSPDQPRPDNEMERFEGMLVSFEGVATGPSDRFGDVLVTAKTERLFREPGIEYPGLAGLPVWDGNPELFDLDPDGLGGPDVLVFAGQEVAAVGPLSFAFGDYQVLPTSLTLGPEPVAAPVRSRDDDELTVGSLNLFRLFDDVDDPEGDQVVSPEEYALRLGKLSRYVREVLDAPDILAVQEAEKLGVLEDLSLTIAADDPAVTYSAFLIEGNDRGGIDVGFLVRDTIAVNELTQLGADEIFDFDGSLLHDRPPLLLEGRSMAGGANFPIVVLNVHNRSRSGIEDADDGDRVRRKRLAQAQSIAEMVQTLQGSDPDVPLVVMGDFNAFEFTDGFVNAVGQIRGDIDPSENLLSGPDLVEPNLANQVLSVPEEKRYSFIFEGSAQVLDHALTSRALEGFVRGLEFGRGNADAPVDLIGDDTTALRASDHDGLVLYISNDEDGDGVPVGLDYCPATEIPEKVPTVRLLLFHFALTDDDGVFDMRRFPFGRIVPSPFTVEDTAGCSCEQILDNLGSRKHGRFRKGQMKFGCSYGVLKWWMRRVKQ